MNSECQGDTLTIRKLKESVSTTNLHDQIWVLYCTLSWKMPIEITIRTRLSHRNATKRESCPRKSSPQEVRLKYSNTQISNTGCVHHYFSQSHPRTHTIVLFHQKPPPHPKPCRKTFKITNLVKFYRTNSHANLTNKWENSTVIPGHQITSHDLLPIVPNPFHKGHQP